MKKIVFLSNTAQSLIGNKIICAGKRWVADWCFQEHSVSAKFLKKNELLENPNYYQVENQEDFISINSDDIDWGAVLFGPHAEEVPNDQIKQQLISSAVKNLASYIMSEIMESTVTLSIHDGEYNEIVKSSQNLPGDKTATYRANIANHDIMTCFSVEGAKGIKDLSLPTQPPIKKPSLKTLNGHIKTHVSMELGEYNLSDINNLSVGDVLKSSVKINTPFSVRTDKKIISNAYIGKNEENKAITLANGEV